VGLKKNSKENSAETAVMEIFDSSSLPYESRKHITASRTRFQGWSLLTRLCFTVTRSGSEEGSHVTYVSLNFRPRVVKKKKKNEALQSWEASSPARKAPLQGYLAHKKHPPGRTVQ